MRREFHSKDGRWFLVGNGSDWDVWADRALVASRPTRQQARELIRQMKADPRLLAVLAVQES